MCLYAAKYCITNVDFSFHMYTFHCFSIFVFPYILLGVIDPLCKLSDNTAQISSKSYKQFMFGLMNGSFFPRCSCFLGEKSVSRCSIRIDCIFTVFTVIPNLSLSLSALFSSWKLNGLPFDVLKSVSSQPVRGIHVLPSDCL